MLAKRIIPCLDVDNGRVVKGVQFVDIKDAGDPVEVAQRYNEQGADEITFLDTEEFGIFDIKWKGKVANTYLGETEFDYDFYVYMKNIKFNGIRIHPAIDKEKAMNFLKTKLAHFDDFILVNTDEMELENYILKLKKQEE